MVQLLTPVAEQCDMRLSAVLEAQKALAKQIHLLSAGASLLPFDIINLTCSHRLISDVGTVDAAMCKRG